MTYVRTDEIKEKQRETMKRVHADKNFDWKEIEKKKKETLRRNGKRSGRKPGTGKVRTGKYFPCPVCEISVYHKRYEINGGIRKFCSRSCMNRSESYRQKISVANKGKVRSEEYLNTRRKESTPEYTRYKNLVHKLSERTYVEHIDEINPDRFPRTLCGVDCGYQLDHIVPVRECFDTGVSAFDASSVENLRMLPWKQNLMRYWDSDNFQIGKIS